MKSGQNEQNLADDVSKSISRMKTIILLFNFHWSFVTQGPIDR